MFRSSKDRLFKKKETVQCKVDNSFSCDLCGQGPWDAELDLEIHRKTEHKWDLLKLLKDENIPICSICLREQKDKQSLIEHILVNHLCCPPNATMINREIFICDHCQRLFYNKQLLIIHIFHWHIKKTPENNHVEYNCPKCHKIIRAKSAWFHLLYHGIFNIGTCPVCLKNCENHYEMLEHVKNHPLIFRCDICRFETTKECYLNSHLVKHRNAIKKDISDDVTRFFVPEQLPPSLNNPTCHIFKGIPLANEVRICILCRSLVFSVEEMEQHIFAAHMPEEKEKTKLYQCKCGEVFFNRILLKQHVFKLKGIHGAWDGVTPIPAHTNQIEDDFIDVYQVYGISGPLSDGVNEVVITAIPGPSDNDDSGDVQQALMEYEIIQT